MILSDEEIVTAMECIRTMPEGVLRRVVRHVLLAECIVLDRKWPSEPPRNFVPDFMTGEVSTIEHCAEVAACTRTTLGAVGGRDA